MCPLLRSPLVSEGAAFDAQEAIARALPGQLGGRSLAVASALRLVELHSSGDPFSKQPKVNSKPYKP